MKLYVHVHVLYHKQSIFSYYTSTSCSPNLQATCTLHVQTVLCLVCWYVVAQCCSCGQYTCMFVLKTSDFHHESWVFQVLLVGYQPSASPRADIWPVTPSTLSVGLLSTIEPDHKVYILYIPSKKTFCKKFIVNSFQKAAVLLLCSSCILRHISACVCYCVLRLCSSFVLALF